MNGTSASNYAYNGGLLSPIQGVGPGPKQIMEGYRKDVMNGFAPVKPRVNPVGYSSQLCKGLWAVPY